MTNNLDNRYMLQRHRKELEVSIAFDDIKDKLYSKFLLTSADLSSIDELDSNPLKVSACLDLILKAKNPVVLDKFILSLNESDVQVYNDMFNKLTNLNELKNMKHQEGTEAILRGAVPRKYKSYIPRKQEKDLEQLLSKQKYNEIIVLKGYPLVGKTSFASHTLQKNPALIFDCFQNTVFWLDLHNVRKEDPSSIADCLKRFIGRITKFDNSNFYLQPAQSLEWYKDVLRSKFHEVCIDGLLVLDNLRYKEVLEYFDIGCKMLIIGNKDCVIKQASKEIELNNFTMEDTFACFASALPLPKPIVNKIHVCMEGHPKLVTLIARYLKERQADKWDSQRWNDWLSQFDNDGDSSYKRNLQFGILQKPLDHIAIMLFEMLSKNELNYFKQLAIMPEHVNIFREVLGVYWDISDLNEVEDILHRFCKLSLLEQKFEEGRYIYGIRNLFLKCLKSTQESEFLVKCHRKLLKAYSNKYGELTMYPNDNYIHNYYGFHLVGANMPTEHFKIFLNLRFIDAKINFCGVGAMLQDFQMYRTYITDNNSLALTNKLDAYIDFVQKCETNLLKHGMDLVQYALRKTDNHQIVFNDALNIAKNSNILYLRWTFKNEPLFIRTLDVHSRFETVLFANDPHLILVGTETGEIQLWNLETKLLILKYIGHTKGIKKLKLSPCKKYFLSVSHDMTFKIWKMYVKDTTCSLIVKTEPLSPTLRQRDHHSFFADETCLSAIGDSSDYLNIIISATFYKDSNSSQGSSVLNLVTCLSDGMLLQWIFQEKDDFPLQRKNHLLVASKNCTFDIVAAGQLFLFIYSQANKRLYVVNPQLKSENKYVCIVTIPDGNSENTLIQQLLAVNDDLCVVISGNIHIVRFQFVMRKGTVVFDQCNKIEIEIPIQGGALSCASLTENGAYLAIGTVDGFIFIWDLKILRIVKEFTTNNCLVIGLDTYITPDSITLLLTGNDDSTVKCWHIASEHLTQHHDAFNSIPAIHRSSSSIMSVQQHQERQMFSCYWLRNNSDTVNEYQDVGTVTARVAMLDEDNNAIQIYNVSQFHTDNLLCSVDLSPCVSNDSTDDYIDTSAVVLFELDDHALYYVLRNGSVHRYKLRDNTDKFLWHCNADGLEGRRVISIKCLGDNSILMGCNRNSLTLIQYCEDKRPTVTILLDPSYYNDDIVRIFQLHQVFNLNIRIIRLLLANRSYVYVLCTERTGTQIHGAGLWINSTYRLESVQGGDCRINECILSSTESHLVLFLSNGQCDILRLVPIEKELSYVSEYVFHLDPMTKITASAISFDGQLLALGKNNGHIEIIDVAKKSTKIILEEHRLPIETLLFSPKPNYILVSAADSICWWKFQDAFEANSNGISQLSFDNNEVWNMKQSTEMNKCLLARISLSGPLKYITASKDFMSFIILDSLGNIHNFNVIPRIESYVD